MMHHCHGQSMQSMRLKCLVKLVEVTSFAVSLKVYPLLRLSDQTQAPLNAPEILSHAQQKHQQTILSASTRAREIPVQLLE